MADHASLLIFVPPERPYGVLCITKVIGVLSPDGHEVRAVKSAMVLITNKHGAAPTEMAWEAGLAGPWA